MDIEAVFTFGAGTICLIYSVIFWFLLHPKHNARLMQWILGNNWKVTIKPQILPTKKRTL
jgi:hypothetical protein